MARRRTLKPVYSAAGNVAWSHFGKQACGFSKGYTLSGIDSAIPLLSIHLRLKKASVHTKRRTQMFIATLLVIGK